MTPPLALVVRQDDPLPPYEQVRRQLERLIRDGTLPPGGRLPALRQLAGDLGLAVGTLARVYRELEAAGLVESRRAAGTRVAGQLPELPAAEQERRLERRAEDFVRDALTLGVPPELVLDAVRRALYRPADPHPEPPAHSSSSRA